MQLGITDIQRYMDEMIVFDYLIANSDRHYNNFALLRNARTLELKMAPIYDNGNALWYDQNEEFMLQFTVNKSVTFKKSHEEQIRLATNFAWIDFDKLKSISEDFRKVFNKAKEISECRLDILCEAFSKRVKFLEDFANK
jgi:ribosomal protein L22